MCVLEGTSEFKVKELTVLFLTADASDVLMHNGWQHTRPWHVIQRINDVNTWIIVAVISLFQTNSWHRWYFSKYRHPSCTTNQTAIIWNIHVFHRLPNAMITFSDILLYTSMSCLCYSFSTIDVLKLFQRHMVFVKNLPPLHTWWGWGWGWGWGIILREKKRH